MLIYVSTKAKHGNTEGLYSRILIVVIDNTYSNIYSI